MGRNKNRGFDTNVICPFYNGAYTHEPPLTITCERGKETFETRSEMNEFSKKYCCDLENHKMCQTAAENYKRYSKEEKGV